MKSLLAWHARQIARHPRRVIAALVVVTLGAVLCLPRLTIESDLSALLPKDHPSLRLAEALSSEEASRTMWLLLEGADLAERLPVLEARLLESPLLETVDASADLPERAGLARATPEVLDALADALAPAERRAALERAKALLAQDPIAGRGLVQRDPFGLRWLLDEARLAAAPPGLDLDSGYLFWPERELALLMVRGRREPFDIDYSNALLDDLAARLEGVEWEALGGYDVARRDSTRIRGDMTRSLGWSIPLLLLALVLSTRSLVVPHLYVVPTLLAVVWALGYGGALVGPLTPLAVGSAAILMGLGVDFCIHYLDRYREERRTVGHALAVERAHVGTGRALFLGMATTLVAFGSLALGSFPGTASFGVLLALGLVGAWFAALSVLPLLAPSFPSLARRDDSPSRVVAALTRLGASRAGLPLALAGGALAVAGWVGALAGGLRFDADPSLLRPRDERFAARAAELDAALGASPLGLRVLVPAERDVTAAATAVASLLDDGLVARAEGPLAAVPGRRQRTTLAEFEERTAGWRAGAEADLVALGFRLEPFRATLDELADTLARPGDAPTPDVTFEGREYRSLTLHPPRTLAGRPARAAFRAEVEQRLGADVLFVDAAGLGDSLGPLLRGDLLWSLGVSAPLVALLVVLVLGAGRASFAALVPVFAGLGIVLGGLVVTGFPLHPGNLLALPLILGLGVDDGIHMVLRWREARGAAGPLRSTGRSIWRTTITTGIGFGSLLFARSPAIASLGALAGVGALVCFLATMLAVPHVLGRYDRAR
ncbi:MAG: MMPL family transporter [Planctomycetota bacterium]